MQAFFARKVSLEKSSQLLSVLDRVRSEAFSPSSAYSLPLLVLDRTVTSLPVLEVNISGDVITTEPSVTQANAHTDSFAAALVPDPWSSSSPYIGSMTWLAPIVSTYILDEYKNSRTVPDVKFAIENSGILSYIETVSAESNEATQCVAAAAETSTGNSNSSDPSSSNSGSCGKRAHPYYLLWALDIMRR